MEGFQALRGMNGPQRFNIHRFSVNVPFPPSPKHLLMDDANV